QTDMAGYAEFQAGTQLTEASDVAVVNWVCGPKLLLVGHKVTAGIDAGARSVSVPLIEILVGSRSTINEAETAPNIRREAAERITTGQGHQAATGEVCLRSETECFKRSEEHTSELQSPYD